MQFNSYVYILAFLPILVLVYFACNKINYLAGKIILIIGSMIFCLYGGWESFFFLVVSILINYLFVIIITRISRRKCFLILDVICNVGMLFYFKYFNFVIYNIDIWFGKSYLLKEIVLPLGISFYTFQQIMYIVDAYHGKICVNFLDYLTYILYFPKIIMGPLISPEDFFQQINDGRRKQINWENIACGMKLISFGLFKKIILADTFVKAVNWGYTDANALTSMDWILVMLFYTFEIYFDFSGYTDMAVGSSAMLNINLPINFDSPYKAVSVRDFWKRWHISLTTFFTRYLYIPLGGSRKGKMRTYANTLLVFLVSGIWHGANWTFILWGVLHGVLSIFDRIFEKVENKINKVVKWIFTFIAVNILWLLFRADSVSQWIFILKRIFKFKNLAISDELLDLFILPETPFVFDLFHLGSINMNYGMLSMLLFVFASLIICLIPKNNYRNMKSLSGITIVLSAIAYLWGFLCLSSESVFIYFNF